MKHKISLSEIPITQSLIKNGAVVWDTTNPPHLFPLYLFLYLKKKYCLSSDVIGIHTDIFNWDDAWCKCTSFPINPAYSIWIHVRRVTDTAITFSAEIGLWDYDPRESFGKKAEFGFGICTDSVIGSSEIFGGAQIPYRENDHVAFFAFITLGSEIKVLFEKAQINASKGSP